MARPKTTPMSTMGNRLRIGPVTWIPSSEAPQPHWNTATTTPNVAMTESTKPSVALMGTRIDRNTTIRSSIARPMTTSR
jgi:hypothetical protein